MDTNDASLQRWFVVVVLGDDDTLTGYRIGPLGSWSRARDIATKWEAENGRNTAHCEYKWTNNRPVSEPLRLYA